MLDFDINEFLRELKLILPEIASFMIDTQNHLEIQIKEDQTPLTQVDLFVHEKMSDFLCKNTPALVLSEEGDVRNYHAIQEHPSGYWLLDPLDGTKEYIRKSKAYCISAGWVLNKKVQFGLLYLPAVDTLYYGGRMHPSKKITNLTNKVPHITDLPCSDNHVVFLSHSHKTPKTTRWVNDFMSKNSEYQGLPLGSAIKFAKVAEDSKSIYPRMEQIMEWDIAGGHGVLLGAGKNVVDINSRKEKLYGAPDLKMGDFIAI